MGELSGLTCIPETVLAFLKKCSEADDNDDGTGAIDFPIGNEYMKLEIISAFIRNNKKPFS